MHTIVVANQKGGVGKSTTTINLGASLAKKGYRVLLIDADHQGHTTKGLGVKIDGASLSDVLLEQYTLLEDAMYPTKIEGLHVVPSNIKLAMVEMKLSLMASKEYRLRKKLQISMKHQAESLKNNLSHIKVFDYCIIDCPPTFGNICINAFLSADWIIMPIQLGYFSMEGVDSFMESLEYVNNEIGDLVNHKIDFLGVLINFYDTRTNISKTIMSELESIFKELIFTSKIPVNVKLNEAQSKGCSIFEHDPLCKGALAYEGLCEEVLKRIKENTDG